mmetsp:Transcript_1731/g.3690  ORF Transcript_1731/g.3690 Transcript_1731/m.3690 type:complete len:175 (+) Transcript_1731:67-591(+)
MIWPLLLGLASANWVGQLNLKDTNLTYTNLTRIDYRAPIQTQGLACHSFLEDFCYIVSSNIWVQEVSHENDAEVYIDRAETLNVSALIFVTNLTLAYKASVPLFCMPLDEGNRLIGDLDSLGPHEAELSYDYKGQALLSQLRILVACRSGLRRVYCSVGFRCVLVDHEYLQVER